MVLLNDAAILAEVLHVHPGPIKAETPWVSWYTIACKVFSSSQSVSFQMNVTFSPGNKSDLWFIWSTAMLIAEAYNSPRWKELPRRSVRLNGIKRPSLTCSVVGEGKCRRNTNHISVASVCMAIGATCCLNPTTTSLNLISLSLRKWQFCWSRLAKTNYPRTINIVKIMMPKLIAQTPPKR